MTMICSAFSSAQLFGLHHFCRFWTCFRDIPGLHCFRDNFTRCFRDVLGLGQALRWPFDRLNRASLGSGWHFAGPSVALLGLALRLPSPGSSASGWRCAGPRGCSLCSHRELFSGQPHLMFSGHPWSRAGASLALRSPYSGWRCACPRRPPWARPRAGASLALGGARFARTETRLRSTLSL
jgi:hypothetical protein